MGNELNQQIEDLIARVGEKEIPAQQWQSFLEKECKDESIVRIVLSLLEGVAQANKENFLGEPFRFKYELAAGAVLQDRYEIVGKIGQGGMGVVYQAKDLRFPARFVAIKQAIFTDNKLSRAFQKEAAFLAQLRHAALPLVSDQFVETNKHFLVMEYIEGKNLAELLAEQNAPFPLTDVISWADRLLDALEYLHAQKPPVIHRDIKPGNLKLTARGEIILIDFGLAKGDAGFTSITESSVVGFTPHYSPLEQRVNKGVEPRSDIYALGATLYHLLTNVKPSQAEERIQATSNKQKDPLQSADRVNSKILPQIANVISKAMSMAIAQRPNATQMREMLKNSQKKDRLLIAITSAFLILALIAGSTFLIKYVIEPRKEKVDTVKVDPVEPQSMLKLGMENYLGTKGKVDFAEAFKAFSKAAESGDAMAEAMLANMYLRGLGTKVDYKKAFQLASSSANKGNPMGKFLLARLYFNGDGTPKQIEKAKEIATTASDSIKNSANAGDPFYQTSLGVIYELGIGVKVDFSQAKSWYEKAANQGDIVAQGSLGYIYCLEEAGTPNYVEALKWTHKAAELGYADAQNNLGGLYENGHVNGKKDIAKAIEWYSKAAEQDAPSGQCNLGSIYETEPSVKDYHKAMEWYKKAAQQDNGRGQAQLGFMYEQGEGVELDLIKAVEWYQKSAEQGEPAAQTKLGNMYQAGKLVKQDDEKAVAWYRKAAEQEFAYAQNYLGRMYQEGKGVKQDDKKAVDFYQKAADQGLAEAQYNLGFMYRIGKGVLKDDKKALEWYQKAANKGLAEAQNGLGKMYQNGEGVPFDFKEAVKWYQKAKDQGLAVAQANLGFMYQFGYGVKEDREEAKRLYQLAAAQGNEYAKEALSIYFKNSNGAN